MCNKGILADDLQVFIEVIEGCTIELLAIIGDDHLRQAELTDNKLLDETMSFLLRDLG